MVPSKTITENLTSQIDGAISTFTTTQIFQAGTLVVELNGQRLVPGTIAGGDGYEESTTQTFLICRVPDVGEHLLVQYEIDDTGTGFPFVQVTGYDPDILG